MSNEPRGDQEFDRTLARLMIPVWILALSIAAGSVVFVVHQFYASRVVKIEMQSLRSRMEIAQKKARLLAARMQAQTARREKEQTARLSESLSRTIDRTFRVDEETGELTPLRDAWFSETRRENAVPDGERAATDAQAEPHEHE